MEASINFHPSVLDYFNELIDVLFYENYFLYRESAIAYVDKLLSLLENQIENKKHHLTISPITKYGKYLAIINMSKNTTWYFVFERSENRYLITFIFNNYSKEAKFLNRIF